jgi:hypothetical protein
MGPRAAPKHLIGELFPFGILPPGFAEGKITARQYDDRAIVLISTTVVEQSLEGALLKRFKALSPDEEREIFSEDGAPLSSFDPKVRIGFALGLFGKLAKTDLATLRHVRNAFAHSRLEITFDTPEIALACAMLRKAMGLGTHTQDVPRERFIMNTFEFTSEFLNIDAKYDEEAEERRRAWLDLPAPHPES